MVENATSVRMGVGMCGGFRGTYVWDHVWGGTSHQHILYSPTYLVRVPEREEHHPDHAGERGERTDDDEDPGEDRAQQDLGS